MIAVVILLAVSVLVLGVAVVLVFAWGADQQDRARRLAAHNARLRADAERDRQHRDGAGPALVLIPDPTRDAE